MLRLGTTALFKPYKVHLKNDKDKGIGCAFGVHVRGRDGSRQGGDHVIRLDAQPGAERASLSLTAAVYRQRRDRFYDIRLRH